MTREQLKGALLAVIASSGDLLECGDLKPHKDKETGEETDETFFSSTIILPKGTALHLGGRDLYPNSLQVKIDGFKLSSHAPETVAAKAATAKRPAVSLDSLDARMERAEVERIARKAAKAAAK